MELPAIKLPNIELPFDIPTLLHPPIDHFAIAIPVLVLIIEIINLFAKKRAIGVISFVLLIIGMAAAVAAYFSGVHDGKEAFDALTQAGQAELKEHRLLGTYLVIASAVVLVFKLLAAMIKRGLVKMLYLLILILFVAGILKQGKDGGELVYEYGANVERVADLDGELFDAKEELDELKEKIKSVSDKVTEKVEAAKKEVSEAAESALEKTSEAVENAKAGTADVTRTVKEKSEEIFDASKQKMNEKASEMVESAKAGAVEAAKAVEEKSAEVIESVKEKAAEVQEGMAPVAPEVEKVPQAVEQPDVATH